MLGLCYSWLSFSVPTVPELDVRTIPVRRRWSCPWPRISGIGRPVFSKEISDMSASPVHDCGDMRISTTFSRLVD
jgi:hypothetical protein